MSNNLWADNDALITQHDLTNWQREYSTLGREIDNLETKRSNLRKKLEAAGVLLGKNLVPEDGAEVVKHDDIKMASTFIEAVRMAIQESPQSIDNAQIKRRISEVPEYRERLENSPNYFYTALKRLELKGQIQRIGEGRYRALQE